MEPRYQHVVFNLLWQLWCSVEFENYRFKTVNLCLCDIFSSCDLSDAKSLVKNATSNYNPDPTGKISFRIFHVVSRNVLWWEVSIVGYFTFFQCFNDPPKEVPGKPCFLDVHCGCEYPFSTVTIWVSYKNQSCIICGIWWENHPSNIKQEWPHWCLCWNRVTTLLRNQPLYWGFWNSWFLQSPHTLSINWTYTQHFPQHSHFPKYMIWFF